ncbi:hypothetical protein TNCV_3890961 [Trichonephila clavipes]|nr:hypothetical protein TNCV_3890961 [Trichonephila clavipes]
MWHVSQSSTDMITCVHQFKNGLANSPLCPLCKYGPMIAEHLSNCPALLHVLSQDDVAAVDEWSRYRIVAGLVTSSSPVPLKTRRVGER